MKEVVFVTGNQKKADYLADYLGHAFKHIYVDLEEIQSLSFKEVVSHKVRKAYQKIGKPVLVEDSGIEISILNRLPGTLTKWFIEELTLEGICRLVDGKDRSVTARCVFGYYDGIAEVYFEGSLKGALAERPIGMGGFGFDSIFIPEGYSSTRAQLSLEDVERTYLKMKPFEKVREFLLTKT
jgi:inosine triphosphate pyrophosphatase